MFLIRSVEWYLFVDMVYILHINHTVIIWIAFTFEGLLLNSKGIMVLLI